jgi:hypothetical protein
MAAAVASPQPPNLSGRRADLTYVGQTLPRVAPYFFVHLDAAAYQNAVGQLEARIGTASDAEFAVGLAQLVAMAQDAHTELNLLRPPYYPLEFRWLDDGVFVTAASAAYQDLIGTRLVAVGDFPVDQVIERLTTVISHEHPLGARSKTQRYLQTHLVLEGLGILPPGPAAQFTFRSLAGDEITRSVVSGSALDVSVAAPNPVSGTRIIGTVTRPPIALCISNTMPAPRSERLPSPP